MAYQREKRNDQGFKKPGGKRFDDKRGEGNRTPERKPFGKQESDRKPYGRQEPDRKPYDKQESDRKPYGRQEPDRKPYGKQESDRKPYGRQEPDKKPFGKQDTERKPYGRQEPERKPFKRQEPERKPFTRQEPERRTFREEPEQENEGLDIIEGRNPVLEALKAGRTINKLLISKGDKEGSIRQIEAIAREKRIVVQEVDRAKLDSLSITYSHQGVIALAAFKDYVEVDDIIQRAREKGEQPFIILLDEIVDAYNLGSIMRTADSVGAHGIVIPKRRAIGLTSAVAKASAGAIEYVPVARVTNLAQTIESLKEKNIWVVGTDTTGDKAFFESDLKGPLALVIGSEGEGIGRLIREKCDFVVKIPMAGSISSLNAAVAGAIVMYEIARQRGLK